MFTVLGLPLHPLVVHAVVVLLPLSAVGAVLCAVRPAWRRTYGVPVLVLALVAVGSVPVATQTGEQLEAALPGPNPLIAAHGARGESLFPWAVGFLVLLAVAVLAGRRADRTRATDGGGGTAVVTTSRVAVIAGIVAAALGVVATVIVVLIGHSGATAVWG